MKNALATTALARSTKNDPASVISRNASALEALVIVHELWASGAWAEGAPHWGGGWFRSAGAARRIEELGAQFQRLVGPRLA